MSFASLGLDPALLRALDGLGYHQPTEIQQLAIPTVLAGHDLLAGAQTGTGKTAAFSLPLLQRLAPGGAASPRQPRALILTPTRELALQVQQSLKEYGQHLRMRSCTIFGGVGMQPQVEALRRGVEIVVATPGRLIDHMQQRTIDLSKVEALVLDEADRMLDMGFLPAMRRILAVLPKQRQTLLFSATFASEIKQLAQQFMQQPAEVQATPANTTAPRVEHRVHPVDMAAKKELLLHLLATDSRQQRLIFTRTKHGADKLCTILERAGHKAMAIHGNKSQNARVRALDGFKKGAVTLLIATDIAARGIDIDDLPVVINYELPMVAEDYVHRIGRTGRNGRSGQAISLVCQDESDRLRAIHRLLGNEIPRVEIDGFVPTQPLKLTAPGSHRSNAPRRPQSNGRPGHHPRPGGQPGRGQQRRREAGGQRGQA
ncbi:DEAD/DEAH box helicase [Pseudomarimonas salicorniae]|uniref:DEAD/DEAH box helicase n=1 Tax=Pseudomarimonas salicorniae TaxID=2933270 RepID=A0ABT0GEP6_9GAMM|nr:DEAD/DEAH box helicase [Lysobacter sp. CAU 1642]MCK7592903.1 DEAD/DEAH box helicase [Lysobacter sp. CAU 1642]